MLPNQTYRTLATSDFTIVEDPQVKFYEPRGEFYIQATVSARFRDKHLYLHKDGVWRPDTGRLDKDEYSGYFKTREEAERALEGNLLLEMGLREKRDAAEAQILFSRSEKKAFQRR